MYLIKSFYYYYVPLKHYIHSYCKSLFPRYYIYHVDYIPQDTLKVYRNISNFTNLNGYVGFQYWDPHVRDSKYILLHTTHLCKALCITDTKMIPYIDHEPLIKLCIDYIKNMHQQDILDILLNGTSIYATCKSYLPSLCVGNNITPYVLALINNMEYSPQEDVVVKRYDYFLNETVVKNNSYIIQI